MSQSMMIVEKGDNCVAWYDTATGERQHRLSMPDFPHEFVADSDNRFAYVGHYGVPNSKTEGTQGRSILVVDMHTRKVVHTYDLGEHARPHGIDLDEQGRLYVLSEQTDCLLVKENPRDFGTFDHIKPVGGVKAHLFALRRDGRRAFSVNLGSGDVTVFDPYDADSTPVSIKTGNRPEGRWLRADEKILYVSNRGDNTISVIDAVTLDLLKTFPSAVDPMRIMHDSKRNRLITINNQGLSVSFYDAETGKELHRHEVSDRPITMCADASLDLLYVAHRMDQVQCLSMDTFEKTMTFKTGLLPDVMHILPEGYSQHWNNDT